MSKTKFTDADELFRGLLKELRVSKNITQTELSQRLRSPQSYVSKFETGERRLDFVETSIVCEALGVDLKTFAKLYAARLAKTRKAAMKAKS